MIKANITLQKGDMAPDVVSKSLLPETHRSIPRTRVNITEDEDAIHLQISARDVSALRAAVNSYLRWISVSMETYNETQN